MTETALSTRAPSAKPSDFENALAAFVFAQRRMERLPDDIEPAEDEYHGAAYSYADRVLIQTPAASISDLRAKAEVLWADPRSFPNNDHVKAFFADLVSLSGHEPSRTFDAEVWLKYFEAAGGMCWVRDGDVIIMAPVDRDLSDSLHILEVTDGIDAVKAVICGRDKGGLAGAEAEGSAADGSEPVPAERRHRMGEA